MRNFCLRNPHGFDRWLKANAVLGSLLAIGMLAMALAGLNSVGRQDQTDRSSFECHCIEMRVIGSGAYHHNPEWAGGGWESESRPAFNRAFCPGLPLA
jgi:hypothetical protein